MAGDAVWYEEGGVTNIVIGLVMATVKVTMGKKCPWIQRVPALHNWKFQGCWKPADPGYSPFYFCLLPVVPSSYQCGNKVLGIKYRSSDGIPSGLRGLISETYIGDGK